MAHSPSLRSLATVALSCLYCCAPVALAQPAETAQTPTKPAAPAPPPSPGPEQPKYVPPPSTRPQYKLDDQGQFVLEAAPAPGTDAAIITQARKLLAEDRPASAKDLLDAWIERNDFTGNRLLPQAYLLRGDAISADGDEYQALYDYEQVIKAYPGSPEFVIAVEREVEIGNRYLHGLDRKWLGMRIANAEDVGVELMVRAQERMPGSRLGERASIELADYFYRERELSSASDAYELFEKNYPTSQYKPFAMERRIYANVARFKGPRYDSRPLTDARVLTRRFVNAYPARAAETGLNDALIVRIDDSAAESMWVSADWYFQRGDQPGGRYVLKRLVAKYPQSAAAERAVKLMIEKGWLKQSALPSAAPAGDPSVEPTPVPNGTPPEAPRPIAPATPAGNAPAPATLPVPSAAPPGAPTPIEPATPAPAPTPGKEPR